MTTNKEILEKYLPSEDFINKVKKDVDENNNQQTKKDMFKYTKEDYKRIATSRYWDGRKLTQKEQSTLFGDIGQDIIYELNKISTVTRVQFGDGYFVFSMGDNSVLHFEIEELPSWEFGIWFSYQYNKKSTSQITFHWFCQQKLWLNKFKPSRSEINCESYFPISSYVLGKLGFDYYDDDETPACTYAYDIINNIKFMLKHPWLASYRDYRDVNLNLEYVPESYAKRYMKKAIKEEINFKRNREKYNLKMLKSTVKAVDKIDGVTVHKVIDKNDEYFECSPRYEFVIKIDSSLDDEEIEQIYDKCNNVIYNHQEYLCNHKAAFKKYADRQIVSSDIQIFEDSEGEDN